MLFINSFVWTNRPGLFFLFPETVFRYFLYCLHDTRKHHCRSHWQSFVNTHSQVWNVKVTHPKSSLTAMYWLILFHSFHFSSVQLSYCNVSVSIPLRKVYSFRFGVCNTFKKKSPQRYSTYLFDGFRFLFDLHLLAKWLFRE